VGNLEHFEIEINVIIMVQLKTREAQEMKFGTGTFYIIL
jgi:hypothetical protein